jgi:hypothetical protein
MLDEGVIANTPRGPSADYDRSHRMPLNLPIKEDRYSNRWFS